MILVIGEALIDLIGRGGKQYEAVVGGANANVSLALALRGENQAFLGRISTDGFGRLIHNHLASHGVNLDLAVEADEQTSLAVANIDEAGVASYSFYINGTADWGWKKEELPSLNKLQELGVKAIQFGCLAMAMEPGNKVIEDWLTSISKNLSVTLSHDLNIRPAVGLSRENELQRVLRINSLSQIIKASDADIQWLCDLDSIEEVEEVASSWSQGKLVVITLGEKGVSAFIDGQKTQVAGFGVKLVDTVGAGDTFMSSLLGELASLGYLGSGAAPASISNQELIEVVRTANAAAALVCERTGCQPPTREEISRKLEIGS